PRVFGQAAEGVRFSEVESRPWERRLSAFSEAAPGLYFRECCFSEPGLRPTAADHKPDRQLVEAHAHPDCDHRQPSHPLCDGLASLRVVATQYHRATSHQHGRCNVIGKAAERLAYQGATEEANDRHEHLEPREDEAGPP